MTAITFGHFVVAQMKIDKSDERRRREETPNGTSGEKKLKCDDERSRRAQIRLCKLNESPKSLTSLPLLLLHLRRHRLFSSTLFPSAVVRFWSLAKSKRTNQSNESLGKVFADVLLLFSLSRFSFASSAQPVRSSRRKARRRGNERKLNKNINKNTKVKDRGAIFYTYITNLSRFVIRGNTR